MHCWFFCFFLWFLKSRFFNSFKLKNLQSHLYWYISCEISPFDYILRKLKRNKVYIWGILLLVFLLSINGVARSQPTLQQPSGQQLQIPQVTISIGGTEKKNELSVGLQILLLMTVLTLAPSILVMMTCFTRIVVVLHFLRQALGTQTQPPNQMLVSLALFLTFFVMQPVIDKANREGLQPYLRDEITQQQALDNIVNPFKQFMLKYTRQEDLALFLKLSGKERPRDPSELSIWTIIPAYSISELRIAFQIGFLLFVPFLVLDMIIASVLMSLGMFLLPPQLISLPLKILLFVLVDGWYLVIDSLLKGLLIT
ncbi:MAG: Flagellar biosynthesis protein FliP [Candidatus Kapaibacterium sp.]|nr:MAG: Flagellar biosynthesis protein FliP [Candidatus Kapabacteria bacterium]